MSKKLFIGGLAYSVTDEELEAFFAEHGTVTSAVVIKDRETNRSKGFGFVEMDDDAAADDAIKNLTGKEINGRAITVSEARPQEPRPPRRDFGGNDRRY